MPPEPCPRTLRRERRSASGSAERAGSRGSTPGPDRPANGRAVRATPARCGAVPESRIAVEAARSARSQSTAWRRHFARESVPDPASFPDALGPGTGRGARGLESVHGDQIRRELWRRGERLGPEAGRRLGPILREGQSGERRGLLGVRRHLAPLHDGGKSRFEGDRAPPLAMPTSRT